MKNLTFIFSLFLLLILHLYFYTIPILDHIDYFIYDKTNEMFNPLKQQDNGSYSVIIDIDEPSLRELGQWPWPRVLDAQLLNMIDDSAPSSLGLNILFPEIDRTSPSTIQEFYHNFFNLNIELKGIPKNLINNDKLLSYAIKSSNATLSIYFSNTPYTTPFCQSLNFQNNYYKQITPLLNASSLICNTKILQNKSKKFGFINAQVDKDGVFRRIPLFMQYKKKVFPSFSLATLYNLTTHLRLPTNQILLNFSNQMPPVYSAIDILNGKISKDKIQGKIVILGSSVVGLNPTYTIPNGEKISNSMVHAITINNILTHSFLEADEKYKSINLSLSFILFLFIIYFFIQKKYFYIVISKFFIIFSSILYLIYGYYYGQYISIAYLLVPLIISSIFMLTYHIHNITQEEAKQKELLIKQNKLASMGEMISVIAHQWRQPLSAINGVVLTLDIDHNKELLDKERLDYHLNDIEKLTSYLSETINNFTNFFSTAKTEESFFIKDVIDEVKILSAIKNYKNIHIHYSEKQNIYFYGLKSELLQALLIILNNAIYACNENLKKTNKGEITIHAKIQKKYLLLSISDNGGGIKASHLNKIFNPYFTTKLKSHGTGLGLYILKLIIEESMNGKIEIENIEEGVMFTLELPLGKPKEK